MILPENCVPFKVVSIALTLSNSSFPSPWLPLTLGCMRLTHACYAVNRIRSIFLTACQFNSKAPAAELPSFQCHDFPTHGQ